MASMVLEDSGGRAIEGLWNAGNTVLLHHVVVGGVPDLWSEYLPIPLTSISEKVAVRVRGAFPDDIWGVCLCLAVGCTLFCYGLAVEDGDACSSGHEISLCWIQRSLVQEHRR